MTVEELLSFAGMDQQAAAAAPALGEGSHRLGKGHGSSTSSSSSSSSTGHRPGGVRPSPRPGKGFKGWHRPRPAVPRSGEQDNAALFGLLATVMAGPRPKRAARSMC